MNIKIFRAVSWVILFCSRVLFFVFLEAAVDDVFGFSFNVFFSLSMYVEIVLNYYIICQYISWGKKLNKFTTKYARKIKKINTLLLLKKYLKEKLFTFFLNTIKNF